MLFAEEYIIYIYILYTYRATSVCISVHDVLLYTHFWFWTDDTWKCVAALFGKVWNTVKDGLKHRSCRELFEVNLWLIYVRREEKETNLLYLLVCVW